MGGGGLRILPHKKWHVWRRDNIEHVLRDEREHEEQQRDRDAKERRLEQERRAEKLVSTGGGRAEEQHINFFKAEEALAAKAKSGGKREEKMDDTLGRHGKLPWYAQAEDAEKNEPTARQERKRKRELEGADPLQHMRPKEGRPLFDTSRRSDEKRGRRGVDEEGPAGSDRRKYSARYNRSSTSPERKGRRGHSSSEDEGDKRSKKRRKHHKEKKNSRKTSKKEAILQELRREREKREAKERRRAERLMYG
ncbi:hypothetical protein PHYSODRAFT_338452 [Phytophthora sojae]|uniref:CBF1-interacting co-repressor CIR N-terminal domain-containing protein n=1 Tax=Phytophthora sojae (strain P6497) TaxID=1094619 RepID=G5A4U5_PHYSP|nr:hypothetical protein PHYSODRAFT_338452 [Phytophthora sojae]EGZ09695.1 hypothetical protein PHYSODRAFT_338452 [Phytophthora sojae]|eukprot:XP_009534556.1 hypothetical protein PHYSODRAFT_338452 [Phytophthora sojae]